MSSDIEAIKKAASSILFAFAAAALVSYFDVIVRMQQGAQGILERNPKAGDTSSITLRVFRIIPIEVESVVKSDPKTGQPCVILTGTNIPMAGTTCHRRNNDFAAYIL